MKDDYNFNVSRERPEETFRNARDYYKGEVLTKYATSKSMMRTQEKITIRALELLDPRPNSLILDLGCGAGFSSIYLNEIGYKTVSLDLIPEFLYYYQIRDINPIAADMCFLPFCSNLFDYMMSISALQWIFLKPEERATKMQFIKFIKDLERIMKPGGRAVFQFYPQNDELMKQMGKFITLETGFKGNFIIDSPQSAKKRKIFLILNS